MSLFDITNFERQGNTVNDIHLDNIDDIGKFVIQLSATALRTVKIFTPNLEREIYDNEYFRNNLLKFARGNRHAQIQILVNDLSSAIHNGHQLIRLAQQLPSAMQIKTTPEDYQDTSMAFILVDQSGFVFKPDRNAQNAIYNTDCKHRANKLLEFFTPAWEQAEQDPHSRQFRI